MNGFLRNKLQYHVAHSPFDIIFDLSYSCLTKIFLRTAKVCISSYMKTFKKSCLILTRQNCKYMDIKYHLKHCMDSLPFFCYVYLSQKLTTVHYFNLIIYQSLKWNFLLHTRVTRYSAGESEKYKIRSSSCFAKRRHWILHFPTFQYQYLAITLRKASSGERLISLTATSWMDVNGRYWHPRRCYYSAGNLQVKCRNSSVRCRYDSSHYIRNVCYRSKHWLDSPNFRKEIAMFFLKSLFSSAT